MSANSNQIAAEIIQRSAEEWLLDLYLPYAHYTIRDRALLLEDGFKPVNRRILWSLFTHGITPKAQHRKAARAAGDTVAYHPHGTGSIEAALARMAQGFVQRVTLIDPEGSVGKVAGDVAAAARYWECRLTDAAMELVKEIPEGAVEMGKNFDGTLDEPSRLPARWPVSIINGSQGIAVGYAAKLWPHNPTEVMKAVLKKLDNPEMTTKQLMKIIPGPDFPTGGELIGTDGVADYLSTGSGTFTIRGRYTVEQLPRGRSKVIFHELPYQISADEVIESVRKAQAANRGRLNDISVIKDLSDKKNGLRLVMETKNGSNLSAILIDLFKMTPIETKFPTNSTMIVDGAPVVVKMLDQLQNFINFRRNVVTNKAIHKVTKLDNRLAQLNAILAVLIDLDKAIKIIRNSDTAIDAQTSLMKTFKLDKDQADYILAMPLRRLTKSDAVSVNEEKKKLDEEIAFAKAILKDPVLLDSEVKKELEATSKIIADKRRTVISGLTTEDAKEAAKELAQDAKTEEKELPCYVTRFANGKLMRTSYRDFYAIEDKELKNGPIVETIKTTTQANLVVVFEDGLARRIPMNFLPEDRVIREKELGLEPGLKIVGISNEITAKSETGLAVATARGEVKIAKTDFPNKDEFPVITLSPGDKVIDTRWISRALTDKRFVLVSKEANILAFDATTIRVSGSKSGGVKGMKLKNDKDEVISFSIVAKNDEANVVSLAQKTLKLTPLSEIPLKNKGGMGVALHAFRAGEKAELKSAYVGANLVALMRSTPNVISLPPLSKRAARGNDWTMAVEFGSSVLPIL